MENMSELYSIEELPEVTFTLFFNLIDRYHQEDSFLKKIKCTEFTKGYFCGGWNTIYLITYKDKTVISQKLQKYVVKWYHTYMINPGLYQTEATILQHFYWPGLKEAVYREVTYCEKCQLTKRSMKSYGKLPAKLAEKNCGTNYV